MSREEGTRPWEVILSEVAETERESFFLNVGRIRGADYARRWWEGLLTATEEIAEFPGPRSFPRNGPESERRRAEVRMRLYQGPDRRNPAWVACKILFAVYDPTQQSPEAGQVRVVRYLRAQSQAAQELDQEG